jgi:hypothetical protein
MLADLLFLPLWWLILTPLLWLRDRPWRRR